MQNGSLILAWLLRYQLGGYWCPLLTSSKVRLTRTFSVVPPFRCPVAKLRSSESSLFPAFHLPWLRSRKSLLCWRGLRRGNWLFPQRRNVRTSPLPSKTNITSCAQIHRTTKPMAMGTYVLLLIIPCASTSSRKQIGWSTCGQYIA